MLTLDRRQLINRLCYLFVIFLIGCLTGWIYEEIFYWYTEGMLRNRGILYGPWLPIYGVGALGIYAMKPFKKNPAVLFLLSAGITGVVEYIIGWIAIRCFGMRLWDYRGLFGNISGIICVRSVVSFALLGLVFHYLIEPSTERVMGRLSSCNKGLTLMSIRASARLIMAMATQLSVAPITAMPGTSHTAAATAMAVTSQRTMKFMTNPFGFGGAWVLFASVSLDVKFALRGKMVVRFAAIRVLSAASPGRLLGRRP